METQVSLLLVQLAVDFTDIQPVNVEVRERKPVAKSLKEVQRLAASGEDSIPEKRGSSLLSRFGVNEEESFDADQQNMPWNAAARGVPSVTLGFKPKSGNRSLEGLDSVPVSPVLSNEKQVTRSIPEHVVGSKAPLVPSCPPFRSADHPPPSVPPSNQFQLASVSTPSAGHSPSQRYEEVTAKLLVKVPEVIRLKFMKTRDPRLLFSYVESPGQKKVLTDWLEANYFIPTSPDTIFPNYSASDSSSSSTVPVSRVLSQPTCRPLPPQRKLPSFDIVSISSDEDGTMDDDRETRVTPHESKDITYGFKRLVVSRHDDSPSLVERLVSARNYKSVGDISGPALIELLRICGQDEPLDFESFVATFPFDADIQNLVSMNEFVDIIDLSFRKVGEASCSEVFRLGRLVLKIIPILSRPDTSFLGGDGDRQGYPNVSNVDDVLREVRATEKMGFAHPGFTRLLK